MTASSEAPETAEAVETTPKVDWIVPNQSLFEQVIDQRLEKLKSSEKPASNRSRSASSDNKGTKPADPKP